MKISKNKAELLGCVQVANCAQSSYVVLVTDVIEDLRDARTLRLGFVAVAALGERVVTLHEGAAQGFVGVVQRFAAALRLGATGNDVRVRLVQGVIPDDVVVGLRLLWVET